MRPSSLNSLQKKKQRQPTIGSTTHQNDHIANAPPLQTATIQRAQLAPRALPTGDILALQRTMGNRQVAQMLDSHHSIQRAPTSEVDAEAGTDIGLEGSEVDGAQAQKIHAPQGGGQPVPKSVRSRVEAQSGTDLGAVRVYSNKDSHTLNRQLNSKAFTHQNNIFLGKNESPHDVQLMAHELTHTIQQTGGQKVQRQGNKSQITPHPAKSEAGIQRKVQNLHLDKRMKRSYSKRINGSVKYIRSKIEEYNAIPMNDTDYDYQLELLEDIREKSWQVYRLIGTRGFMDGSVRKFGGPFRAAYYMLQRNLSFMGITDGGFAGQEFKRVEAQKNNPIQQASNRREEHEKNGGDKQKSQEPEEKYDFRDMEKAAKEQTRRTFKLPTTASSIPSYDLLGEVLAASISPGSTVIATGVAVKVQLQDRAVGHPTLEPGKVILMYEFISGGIKIMVPASMWDAEVGPNTYPRDKTPKDVQGFDYWISTWHYSASNRKTNATQERAIKRLNGIHATGGHEPKQFHILDESHADGGFPLLNNTPKQDPTQDTQSLNASNLEIPQELMDDGNLTMLESEENLDSSSLEIPEDLEKEGGFSLL